jgi:hypothetical protein
MAPSSNRREPSIPSLLRVDANPSCDGFRFIDAVRGLMDVDREGTGDAIAEGIGDRHADII